MIDGFNEVRMQIDLTADESMSAKQFCTTPKEDLWHYFYIFMKTEPLGAKMKHVACSRLGTMLHLDIQKGKQATKTSIFQKYLRGTEACIKIRMMAKKGCGQLTSNDTYFYEIWFNGVKTAEEAMDLGVNFCGLAKKGHKGFVYLHQKS